MVADLDALVARVADTLGAPGVYEYAMRPPSPISLADVRALLAAVATLRRERDEAREAAAAHEVKLAEWNVRAALFPTETRLQWR